MKRVIPAAVVCLVGSCNLAYGSISDFQINGFFSAGAAWSDVDFLRSGVEPTYISHIRKDPSFDEDTNVGIQLTKNLSEEISITTQLFADAGDFFDDYAVEAVWAFIKYEPSDKWQFRAGRVRTNPYMLSEYLNVSYAYPWVRPPQEVYSQLPFSNFTGVDATFKYPICHRDLTIGVFYGSSTGHMRIPIAPASTVYDRVEMRLRNVKSIYARFGDETFSVRAGYEYSTLSLMPNTGTIMQALNNFMDTAVTFRLTGPEYINYFAVRNVGVSFMGLGYQFDWKNVVSMAEIVKRRSVVPIIANTVGWYVMGGYHVGKLLPHITYARERIVDNKKRRFNSAVNAAALANFGQTMDAIAQQLTGSSPNFDGGAGDQSSVTYGIRWDVYAGVALKVEYQRVHPDRLSSGLFDFNPHKSVNIYSVAVAAVM